MKRLFNYEEGEKVLAQTKKYFQPAEGGYFNRFWGEATLLTINDKEYIKLGNEEAIVIPFDGIEFVRICKETPECDRVLLII